MILLCISHIVRDNERDNMQYILGSNRNFMGKRSGNRFIIIIILVILAILGFSYYMGGEKNMENVTQPIENPIKGKASKAT